MAPLRTDQESRSAVAELKVGNGIVCYVGRSRIINRASIIRAALQIADETGLHSLTLAAVARRLGVTAMSLYGHIDNKAALLDGIVEELLAEFALPDEDLPWRERLSLIGRAARDWESYDRIVARCEINGRSIGDLMRAAGVTEGGRAFRR